MSQCVLDASALLALLNEEVGSDQVARLVMQGASISSVNLSEVVAKLSEAGVPEIIIREIIGLLDLSTVDFDADNAYYAGLLRPLTKQAGLSLGDRTCLALAQSLKLPAYTTDRVWEGLSLGITIQVIR